MKELLKAGLVEIIVYYFKLDTKMNQSNSKNKFGGP